MSAVIRVECAVCGPLAESTDHTMTQALASRHERNFGKDHEIEMVVA